MLESSRNSSGSREGGSGTAAHWAPFPVRCQQQVQPSPRTAGPSLCTLSQALLWKSSHSYLVAYEINQIPWQDAFLWESNLSAYLPGRKLLPWKPFLFRQDGAAWKEVDRDIEQKGEKKSDSIKSVFLGNIDDPS